MIRFSVVILLFLTFSILFRQPTFAQKPSSVVVSLPISLTPEPENINYQLPYPGILPDNPLYVLKALRDNVIGALISDPIKKTKFDILQADKRLESGVYLIQESRDKTSLALTTISKGENYMADALNKIQQAKAQGESTNDMVSQLRNSTKKHEEVLKDLEKQIPSSQLSGIQVLEQRVNVFIQQANQLKSKI